MKRILLALASFAFYRWYNSQPSDTKTAVKRSQPRAKPEQPSDI